MSEFELVRLEYHELEPSPGFAAWLAEEHLSLAFTNGGRLFIVGVRGDGDLAVVERQYGTPTGVAAVDTDTLIVATKYQIWRLENALPRGVMTDDGHERFYVPQTAWTTGLLGVHDLAVDGDGRIVFVNGRFSCLATVSETLNFVPLWKPPFVSALVPEDRCHLSGVALVDGRPAYVTCASRTDTADGWRQERAGGGVVVSVDDGSVIAAGLTLPASPVVHDGSLWICNGGTGELGLVDVDRGSFEPVAALAGLARGLAINGRWAAVATSRPRWGETFGGLPFEDRLAKDGARNRCGVFVVSLDSGRVEHSLLVHGVGPDIFGLAFLPGVGSASHVAFRGDDVETWVTIPCVGA